MSKKHKKKKKHFKDQYLDFESYSGSDMIDKAGKHMMEDVAETLERYADIAERYLIISDISYDRKAKALAKLRKAAQKLRNGDPSYVWDSYDRYEEEVRAWIDANRQMRGNGTYSG